MSNQELPDAQLLTTYARNQIQLYPRRYGYVGSYSRELLEFTTDDTSRQAVLYDQLLVRLTTSVLSGRTINENPQVELKYPSSWFQHLKHDLFSWRLKFGFQERSKLATAVLWVVARTLFLVLDKWRIKRPAKFTTMTGSVTFTQDVLYPEIDAPAHLGRPVIFEEIGMLPFFPGGAQTWATNLNTGTSRFMNQHEIMSEMQRDREFVTQAYSYPGSPNTYAVLQWLERHGVNVDQLVKRR